MTMWLDVIKTYHYDGTVTRAERQMTAQEIAMARAGMTAFRRAFRAELRSRPLAEIPALAAAVPNAPHLLAAADAYAASLEQYHPVREIWDDVTVFLRSHPDMQLFTAPPPEGLGVSEEWLDSVFAGAAVRAE